MLSYVSNTSVLLMSLTMPISRSRSDRLFNLTAESDSDLSDFFLSRLPTESRVGWFPLA